MLTNKGGISVEGLAFATEQVTKWLDGGCSSWGLPEQSIRALLLALSEREAAKDAEIVALRDAMRMNAERLSVEAQINDGSLNGAGLRRKMGFVASEMFAALTKGQVDAG